MLTLRSTSVLPLLAGVLFPVLLAIVLLGSWGSGLGLVELNLVGVWEVGVGLIEVQREVSGTVGRHGLIEVTWPFRVNGCPVRIRIVPLMHLLLTNVCRAFSIVLETRLHRISEWLLKIHNSLTECWHYILADHCILLCLISVMMLLLILVSISILFI